MLKLYSNIKRYRTENGMSQSELAAKVGYADKTMISRIENGLVDLPQSKIEEFAKVFGIEPGVLMGWSDPLQPLREQILQDQLNLFQYEGDNEVYINEMQSRLSFDTELYRRLSEKQEKEEIEQTENEDFNDEMKKAFELYQLYEKADPNVKAAIDTLLKATQ